MYISTKPDTLVEGDVIARAKQLTDFKWTPLRDVPAHSKTGVRNYLFRDVEISGIPYSSTEATDKFITENVSFETFLSAVLNPDSVLYTMMCARVH